MLINGTPKGFFSPSRGIRQGDHVFPFLFIFLLEALGRYLKQQKLESSIKGINISNNSNPETHQQFVDDALLYGEASIEEANILNSSLINYTKVSSQDINSGKSEIFFFNMEIETQKKISLILNIKMESLPCRHLGFQLNYKSKLGKLWEPLIVKIRK